MRTSTGKDKAQQWSLPVRHALYRETGDWYHQLEQFPGALCDAHGYIIFDSLEAFRACPQLRIGKDVSVPNGISSIPGYVLAKPPDSSFQAVSASTDAATHLSTLHEGAATEVTLTRYERDPRARAACIKHYGSSCSGCGMSFSRVYGPLGAGFIHVHHLEPLSVTGERNVDPIAELRPICPNCHAMVHRRVPPLSIPELVTALQQARSA